MVQQFQHPQIQHQENPFVSNLNSLLNQGLGYAVQSMFEEKQQKKQLEKQRSINTQSATSLADNLGLQGDEKSSFVGMFSNLAPKEQYGALKQLSEARIYNQFLGEGQPSEEGFDQQYPQERQFGREQISQGFPGQEEGAENIAPVQKTKAPEERVKINGIEFNRSELPKKEKTIPPFGPLAKAAEIQESQRKENRKEVNKFIEPYKDISALKTQKNKIQEAKRIVENEDLGGDIRNITIGILDGKDEHALKEYIQTPAQHKLYSLLYDSIRSKELGGSNPSTREVMFSLARLPSGLKGKEANKYIIDRMLEEADRNLEKGKVINASLKYDPNMNVNSLSEIISNKVPTKINAEAEKYSLAEKIFDEAGGDPVKARQIAKERGLEF